MKLKPCPFCDEKNPQKVNDLVYCIKCQASGYIDVWNTRPIEDALVARIAELERWSATWKASAKIWRTEADEQIDLQLHIAEREHETTTRQAARIKELEKALATTPEWVHEYSPNGFAMLVCPLCKRAHPETSEGAIKDSGKRRSHAPDCLRKE